MNFYLIWCISNYYVCNYCISKIFSHIKYMFIMKFLDIVLEIFFMLKMLMRFMLEFSLRYIILLINFLIVKVNLIISDFLRLKVIVQFTVFLRPIFIVILLLRCV